MKLKGRQNDMLEKILEDLQWDDEYNYNLNSRVIHEETLLLSVEFGDLTKQEIIGEIERLQGTIEYDIVGLVSKTKEFVEKQKGVYETLQELKKELINDGEDDGDE